MHRTQAVGIEHLFVSRETSIREAMACIGLASREGLPSGIALVVSPEGMLEGVVTDGDIRRGLLDDVSLEAPVEQILTPDPIVFDARMTFKEILEEIPRRRAEKGRYRGGVLERIILVDDERRPQQVLSFMDLWRNQGGALHRHVAVVGMGYVGLTLAVTMADLGFNVSGVEAHEGVRTMLQEGRPHFHEVGLEPLLKHHVKKDLKIVDTPPASAEVYILAVATPVHDQVPDLSHLLKAAYQVGKVLTYGDLVVLRSTCPVGTCRKHVVPLLEEASGLRCGRDFYLAFAPERTLEGKALAELRTLPQVIGGYDQNSLDMAASLFREISPLIISASSLEAAEMVKLVNNSFRDMKFAFANELAMICERYNLDTVEVVRAANEGYPRDGVPVPSPGVGGACLVKDPYIYALAARDAQIEHPLSIQGRAINEAMPGLVAEKVLRELRRLGKDPAMATVFIVGFAFKGEPETSDMRYSSTLDVVERLRPAVRELRGYDPVVDPAEIAALGVRVCDVEEGFRGADAVIVMNNHRSYAHLDIFKLLGSMARPGVYVDTWHVFSPKDVKQIPEVTYLGLGFSA